MIIPHELKAEFCYRLGLMNVTAAALFPGVEGVCSAIRDALRLAVANLPTGTDPAAPPESLPVKLIRRSEMIRQRRAVCGLLRLRSRSGLGDGAKDVLLVIEVEARTDKGASVRGRPES